MPCAAAVDCCDGYQDGRAENGDREKDHESEADSENHANQRCTQAQRSHVCPPLKTSPVLTPVT